MRRSRRGPLSASPVAFDMTPMIDVTFQLIVFFLVANDLSRKDTPDLELPTAVHCDEMGNVDLRITVNVLRAPAGEDAAEIRVAGRRVDLATLRRALHVAADRGREPAPPGSGTPPSSVQLLLRADRDVPWRDVQEVLRACAHPNVRIWRVEFAALRPPER